MSRLTALFVTTLLVPALAVAESKPARYERVEPPPPPTLEDKGIHADEPAPTAVDPMQPDKPDTRLVRDKAAREQAAVKERIAASDLTVRQQGDDTVEEYRQNGKVWMIRIVPPDGPNRVYMDNSGSGKLARDPRLGPIDPVYFTIYEWN